MAKFRASLSAPSRLAELRRVLESQLAALKVDQSLVAVIGTLELIPRSEKGGNCFLLEVALSSLSAFSSSEGKEAIRRCPQKQTSIHTIPFSPFDPFRCLKQI